jgi:hypothetical protein
MSKVVRATAVALVVCLVAVSAALAAHPVKGGEYLYVDSRHFVDLKVHSDGRSLSFVVLCGADGWGLARPISINASGKFSFNGTAVGVSPGNKGGTARMRLSGVFKTSKLATGTVNVDGCASVRLKAKFKRRT